MAQLIVGIVLMVEGGTSVAINLCHSFIQTYLLSEKKIIYIFEACISMAVFIIGLIICRTYVSSRWAPYINLVIIMWIICGILLIDGAYVMSFGRNNNSESIYYIGFAMNIIAIVLAFVALIPDVAMEAAYERGRM